MLCCVVVGYQLFWRALLLIFSPLHPKMEATSQNNWYPSATQHSVTIQKTLTWIFTAVKTSILTIPRIKTAYHTTSHHVTSHHTPHLCGCNGDSFISCGVSLAHTHIFYLLT